MKSFQVRSKFKFFKPKSILVFTGVACCGLALWQLQHYIPLDFLSPSEMEKMLVDLTYLGPILYIGILILSVVVCQIPGMPLAMAASNIWGPFYTGIYSVIGGFLGALLAYWLGATLGRSLIKSLTGKVVYFSQERSQTYLAWFIFVTRLLPLLSFDLISYAAGVSGLSLPLYALATLLGMIPSTFLITYLGSAIKMGGTHLAGLAVLFLVVLVALPWLIRRYNLLGLRDMLHVE